MLRARIREIVLTCTVQYIFDRHEKIKCKVVNHYVVAIKILIVNLGGYTIAFTCTLVIQIYTNVKIHI